MSYIVFLGYNFALSSYWYLFLLGGFSEKHEFHGVGSPSGGAIFEKKQPAKPRMSLFENGFKLCFDTVELKISSRASGIRAHFFLKPFCVEQ